MTSIRRPFSILSSSRLAVVLMAAALIASVGLARIFGDQEDQPIEFTHNIFDAPAPVAGAVFGSGPRSVQAIASARRRLRTRPTSIPTARTPAQQRDVDRRQPDQRAEHDRRRQRLPARRSIPADTSRRTVLSRAHVTFDGGHTWSEYPILFEAGPRTRARATRPSPSTRRATPTTRRSASSSSDRPTRSTRISWSRTRATAAGPGRRCESPAGAATKAASATCSTRNTSPPGAMGTRSSPLATSAWVRRARSSAAGSTAR